MFGECANPDCKAPFNYRAGRLVPVRKQGRNGQPPAGHHGVEHFWLCESCSEAYMFEWECGAGKKIKIRAGELWKDPDLNLAAVG